MDEFPGNSQRKRPERPETPARKKVEKVTSGKVLRRKKSRAKRLKEMFTGGDSRSLWEAVVEDTVVPAFKHLFQDAIETAIEGILWQGERRGGRRGRPGMGHVNYQDRSRYRSDPRREDSREMSRRGRSTHDFDEIIVESRHEAGDILDNLFELVSKFDEASVADLYDMVDITPTPQDQRWGWTDISGARAVRVNGGYLLDLPRPEPLR